MTRAIDWLIFGLVMAVAALITAALDGPSMYFAVLAALSGATALLLTVWR